MYLLALPRNPCLHLMNRLNSLKHVQNFNAYSSNHNKEKEKKENSQFTTLCNTSNITAPSELA